eukprot:5099555-Pyramimonas_sp.AAC.3
MRSLKSLKKPKSLLPAPPSGRPCPWRAGAPSQAGPPAAACPAGCPSPPPPPPPAKTEHRPFSPRYESGDRGGR